MCTKNPKTTWVVDEQASPGDETVQDYHTFVVGDDVAVGKDGLPIEEGMGSEAIQRLIHPEISDPVLSILLVAASVEQQPK